jgi:hypothetical protein
MRGSSSSLLLALSGSVAWGQVDLSDLTGTND